MTSELRRDQLDINQIGYVPDFKSGTEYEKDNVVVINDDDTLYIYRAKKAMTPSVFDYEDWELLGVKAFGNVDGGKASSVFTIEQNINGGHA